MERHEKTPETLPPSPLPTASELNESEHITPGQIEHGLVHKNSKGLSNFEELRDLYKAAKMQTARIEKMHATRIEKTKRVFGIVKKDIEEIQKKLKEHEKKIDEHEKKLEQCEMENTSLKSSVRFLAQTSDGYMSARKRFLDGYQRDVLNKDLDGSEAMSKGNNKAHQGDALADAVLYDREKRYSRADMRLYQELYGLNPCQVLELSMYQNWHLALSRANDVYRRRNR